MHEIHIDPADPPRDNTGAPLSVLVVATKPPWPAVDGGRLLLLATLAGLARRGHRLTLVAPLAAPAPEAEAIRAALAPWCTPHLVPIQPRSYLSSALRSRLARRPLTIDRHTHDAIADEVARLLDRERFDVVHVEQLQALAQAKAALDRGIPLVLRAQNVESDLWAKAAAHRPFVSLFAKRESRRLAANEGEAVAEVAVTLALTEPDAARLLELAGHRGRVEVLHAPFEGVLPAGERALPGAPAVVLLGSEGWAPNRDSVAHFVSSLWPAVARALPSAELHVFGNWQPRLGGERVHGWPSPPDSAEPFAQGSILVLPLRYASGVRMRILEAWARGIPVVATPAAAAGLDASDGVELLLAESAADFARAIGRLAEDAELRGRLVQSGRALLARRHDPANAARALEGIYRELAAASRASVKRS